VIRLPGVDLAALLMLNKQFNKNMTQRDVARLVGREPRVNISEAEIKRIKQVDMQAVLSEYKERITAPLEDPNRVTNLAVVLDKFCPVAKCGNAAELGLDAFELQLAANGLITRGQNAVLASVFTTNFTNRFLFSEFIRRVMIEPPAHSSKFVTLNDLIAMTELVPSGTTTIPKVTAANKAKALMYLVSQGAGLPKVKYELTSANVKTYKLGVALELTYETLRQMTMNLITLYLGFQAENMARQHAIDALDKLVTGATTINTTAVAGEINHKEFIKAKTIRDNLNYPPNLVVYGGTVEGQLLDNDAFYHPKYGLLETGRLSGIGGMTHKLAEETSNVSTNKLAYIDTSRAAIDLVEAGSNISETQKYVETQTEVFTYSKRGAFAKLDAAAVGIQTVKA
jgi:hypothetical protein